MKRFFVFSVSCLMLAVAFVLFVQAFRTDAQAQVPGNSQVLAVCMDGTYGKWYVIYDNGDIYRRSFDTVSQRFFTDFVFTDNLWRGSTVNVQPETWSGVKEKYR